MKIINYIFDYTNRVLVFSVLILLVLLSVYVSLKFGYIFGLIVCLIPVGLIVFVKMVNDPYFAYIILFVANYLISGVARYIRDLPFGIVMDMLFAITIASFILNGFNKKSNIQFKNSINGIVVLAIIWFLFCVVQIFNPNSSSIVAWLTSVRGIGLYFLLMTVLTSVAIRSFKGLKEILFIWAILSCVAVAKAMIQRYLGFDSAENYWLFVQGGRSTHIIYSGIRYFSFFTDAATFGSGIAFSGVVFAITAVYEKKIKYKIFYFITAALCMYGMALSGTRGSLAVPFVGFVVYAILSKHIKTILVTLAVVISAFVFLKYTYYGQGNQYVRRMRSVFNSDDASLTVRLENQKRLKVYMMSKPIGVGIGMSRADADNYRPDPVISTIPSDSWYVYIWMENGIIGLLLHIAILVIVLVHGCVLVFFILKNPEIRGVIMALTCGIAGLYVASYTIQIIGQFPFGPILYITMAFIYLSPVYDRELTETKAKGDEAANMKKINPYGTSG